MSPETLPIHNSWAFSRELSYCLNQRSDLQEQLQFNANPALKQAMQHQKLQSMVAIPVAGHKESPYIGKTLRNYANQRLAPNFGLALSLNYPTGADLNAVRQTRDEIFDFTDDHPNLPLTYLEQEYPVGTAIGEVRGDLAYATIGGIVVESFGIDRVPHDFYIVIADADTEHLNALFMHQMGNTVTAQEHPELSFVYATLRNARSHGRVPNKDSVIAWQDLLNQHSERYADSHVAMGLGTILAGEYDPNCAYGETTLLLQRSQEVTENGIHVVHEPTAIATVSARHGYVQLDRGESVAFEPVRSELETYRAEWPQRDISLMEAWRHIDRERIDQIPNVVYGVQERLIRENPTLEPGVAMEAAKKRTLHITTKGLSFIGASPQIVRAVESQLSL